MTRKTTLTAIALLNSFSLLYAPQVLASTYCPNTAYGWHDGRGGSLGESIMNISMNNPKCYCKFNPKWFRDQMGKKYYTEWVNECKKR